jgi:hypothetical protein
MAMGSQQYARMLGLSRGYRYPLYPKQLTSRMHRDFHRGLFAHVL